MSSDDTPRRAAAPASPRGDPPLPAPEPDGVDATIESSPPAPPADPPPRAAARSRPTHFDAEQIGPYRILETLGEGGMGVVYKAEQKQPVRRMVALKVIKLGMDTKEVVARFEVERQALALLNHPNVAKVYEAGVTDRGRPYFAMEFVAGISLTRYCDESRLTTKERLGLFVQVCHAIQHAHQKGIIHRDLKPSNVLVTHFDGKPVPKVIDFGIAKAANQALTDRTLYTRTGSLIGTPAYMSPEQALTSGLDVDTRTDVYSLGVILYELLTGTLPLDPKTLHEASLEQMARFIKTVEPPKPSTRLAMLAGGPAAAAAGAAGAAAASPSGGTAPASGGSSLAEVASLRRCDARALARELRGDLDWIVLKAMEKDRTRRYETANGLAMDIRRHLDHEPVLARPPSTAYRLQKFVRRYRVGVTAAAVVGLALVLGVIGTGVGLLRARAAEHKARDAEQVAIGQRNAVAALLQDVNRARAATQAQAERATAVSGFLQSVLASAQPDVLGGGPDARVVDLLRSAELKVAAELADQPEAEIQTRYTLFRTYQSLGLWPEAMKNLGRGYDLVKQAGARPTETDLRVAGEFAHWGVVNGIPPAECEPIARAAAETAGRVLGEQHETSLYARGVLAFVLDRTGKTADAEAVFQRLVGQLRRLGPSGVADPGTVVPLLAYALILQRRGDLPQAESIYREALESFRACRRRSLPLELIVLEDLTDLLRREDRWAEMASLYERTLADVRPRLGDSQRQVRTALAGYVEVLRRLGRAEDAARVRREIMAALVEVAAVPAATPGALSRRAEVRAQSGQFQEALADYTRATELEPLQEWWWFRRGCLLAYLGDEQAYRQHCREVLGRFAAPDPGRADERMAKSCLLRPGAPGVDQARTIIDRALPSDADVFLAWDQLTKAMAEYRAGQFEECIRWAGTAKGGLANEAGKATAELFAAMAHHRLGRREQARQLFDGVDRWVEQELPKAGVDDIGARNNLENWLILHVALREAKALIGGGPAKGAARGDAP